MAQCGEIHIQSFKSSIALQAAAGSYKGSKINMQRHLADQPVSQERQAAQSQGPKMFYQPQEKSPCEVIPATPGYWGREQSSRVQAGNASA